MEDQFATGLVWRKILSVQQWEFRMASYHGRRRNVARASQDNSLNVVCIGKESNRLLRALNRAQAARRTATNGYILSSGSLESPRKAYP